MLKSKNLVLALIFFLSLGINSVMAMDPMMHQPNRLVGKQAPEFIMPDLNAKNHSLDELRTGKNVILFFWTTWCPHCRTQLKKIQANKEKFTVKDFDLILVNSGESSEQVAQYINRQGITFNVYLDLTGQVSEQYQLIGFPTYVFINQDGIITAVENSLPEKFYDYFK